MSNPDRILAEFAPELWRALGRVIGADPNDRAGVRVKVDELVFALNIYAEAIEDANGSSLDAAAAQLDHEDGHGCTPDAPCEVPDRT